MRALAFEGKRDPQVRGLAISLTNLVPERDDLGEIRTLFEFVRDRIRYVSDINDTETLHAAFKVYELGAGDCDDKVILLASLLESIGYRTRFVAAGYVDPTLFDHVYMAVMLSDGRFLPLDPSEPEAPGWSPPGPLVYMLED